MRRSNRLPTFRTVRLTRSSGVVVGVCVGLVCAMVVQTASAQASGVGSGVEPVSAGEPPALPEAVPEVVPEAALALAGPTIRRHEAPTLVEWTYAGRLKELDALPEEAAVTRIPLSERSLADANAVIAERQSLLDNVLAENLMLALQIDAATKAEEKLKTARLTFELLSKLESLCTKPTLREEIARTLEPEEAEVFRRTLREYDAAYQADARADMSRKAQDAVGIALQRAGLEFQGQLERSFKRIEASGRLGVEYVLAQLQLPDDQARQIRDRIGGLIGASPEGMAEKDYAKVFLAIAASLNEEQRTKLAEILHGL